MAKKSPFLVWTPQFCSVDPINPSRDVAFIGELITLKDTPSISNRLASRGQTPAKKNTSWPISPLYSIHIQKKVLGQNKKAQTHLKSFNGRQGGILQSISSFKLAYIPTIQYIYTKKVLDQNKKAQTHLKSIPS